jgi:hypothetical protein
MFDPNSPAELFADTAIAVATLFFISGAILLVNQALTIGLITNIPATAIQTPVYNAGLSMHTFNIIYPNIQIKAPAIAWKALSFLRSDEYAAPTIYL